MKSVVWRDVPLEEVERMAVVLWRGDYGYDCAHCRASVYGRSVEWCHAHLLEHLVEILRA